MSQMIPLVKISGLNKFFNKNKTNQLHVLNQMTLDLPSQGLVMLLGPSGSGKTEEGHDQRRLPRRDFRNRVHCASPHVQGISCASQLAYR